MTQLEGTILEMLRAKKLCSERALTALLRRDWAVRVLDGFGRVRSVRPEYPRPCVGGGFVIGSLIDTFPSEDHARIAEAEAILPKLPESVRAEIGERP